MKEVGKVVEDGWKSKRLKRSGKKSEENENQAGTG